MVEQLDATSFAFTTKEGLHYLVGFSPDYSLAYDGIYQFHLIERDHKHGAHDSNVLKTAIVIIEEFFKTAPGIMVYICDTSDARHAVRNRLFRYWFSSYSNNSMYVLVTEDVKIDGNKYFAGLMIQKTNPQIGEIIQSFHEFMQSLPIKFTTN